MTTISRHDRDRSQIKEPQSGVDRMSAQRSAEEPLRVALRHRLLGGALAGLVAGGGMYAVLAVFAMAEHRGPGYPLRAVHALMSGARVLPAYGNSLYGTQSQDRLMAPLFFFGPALAVAIFTALRVSGNQRRHPSWSSWRCAAAPAIAASSFFFLLLVSVGWLRDATPAVQRFSTGYGIRHLGVIAWLLAHAVYLTLLVTLVGPLTHGVALIAHRRDGSSGDSRRATL